MTPCLGIERPNPRHLRRICAVSDLFWRVQLPAIGLFGGLLMPPSSCPRGVPLRVCRGGSGAKSQAASIHWFYAVSCGLVVCRVVPAVCFWFLAAGWCSPPFSFREVLSAAGWGLVTGCSVLVVRLRRGRELWAGDFKFVGWSGTELPSSTGLLVRCAAVELFLGYDPGGDRKHGVAAVRVAENGELKVRSTKCLRDAAEVRDWLRSQPSPRALGIDTLLAWTPTGGSRRKPKRMSGRACDIALAAHYNAHSNSVMAQNSLRSAMTVNGIIVAMAACDLGPPLVESHPKLLMKGARHADPEMKDLCAIYDDLCIQASDHEADAVVAAWCASRGVYQKWQSNLYEIDENSENSADLLFPAGKAVYPWPEHVAAT